jgi:mechanosensitive ion channel-like protein
VPIASSRTASGLGCAAMPAGHLRSLLLTSFWEHNKGWVSAAITLVLAAALAWLVDRAFQRRSLSRRADTRLRFLRRLVYATILLLGVALALSQFTGINRLAASVLASGALAVAVLGFAAQRTLGNFIAGVMLAVTQPLRIGDWIQLEDQYGMVEDVRLNFTVIRTPGQARVIIPNERIASGLLRNDTLVIDTVAPEASLWIPRGADADAALAALAQETGGTATVAEVAVDGVRIAVSGERVSAAERGAAEAELRARCLRRLRHEALI